MRKRSLLVSTVMVFLILFVIAVSAQAKTKIRFSDVGPMDLKTNSYYLMVKIIEEQLEKYFPGQYQIEYYPSSQLYKSIPAHKAVLQGSLEACYSYDGLMKNVLGNEAGDPFLCTMLPIFDDFDQYYKACMEVIPLLSKEYLEPRGAIAKGIKAGWGGNLFLTKPNSSLADLKGASIRVIPGPVTETCAKLMGLNSVAMDFAEALAACKSGTVDGMMSTFGAGGVRLKFYSAAKYVTPCNIPGISNAAFWFWNLKFWNSLPQEVRNKLDKEILPYAQKEAYKADRLIFDTGWDIMTADGAVRCNWSKAAVKEFYDKCAEPTIEKMTPAIGEKWIKIVRKYAAKNK